MNPVRKIIFAMFSYPILVIVLLGFSPQAHSSVSLSCPCNDTKGWGDCARECCLGIARLCCSKNPETEPLTKGRLPDQSLPKAEKKYSPPLASSVPTAAVLIEEMAVPPLPVPHPRPGGHVGHNFGGVSGGIAGGDFTGKGKPISTGGHTGHNFGGVSGGISGGNF